MSAIRERAPSQRLAYLAVAVLLMSTACQSSSAEATAEATAPTSSPIPAESLTQMPGSEVPTDLLEDVVGDAAQRAGVDASKVRVVAAESVTWSDGSLGCPEPGMMYTQALVPGYRVVIAVEGEDMTYHASESGDFRFCEDPQPPLEDRRDT